MQDRFKDINVAYDVLGSAEKKKSYDEMREPKKQEKQKPNNKWNDFDADFNRYSSKKRNFFDNFDADFNRYYQKYSSKGWNQGGLNAMFNRQMNTVRGDLAKMKRLAKEQFDKTQKQAERKFNDANNTTNGKSFFDQKDFFERFRKTQQGSDDRKRLINMLLVGFGSLFLLQLFMSAASGGPSQH